MPKEIAETSRKMGLETVRHGNGTGIKLTSPSVLSVLSERSEGNTEVSCMCVVKNTLTYS